MCACVIVVQPCLTPCNSMNCWLPGFSVAGILQARILEWIAIPFSRGSSWPKDRTRVSCTAGRFFIPYEPPGKQILNVSIHLLTEQLFLVQLLSLKVCCLTRSTSWRNDCIYSLENANPLPFETNMLRLQLPWISILDCPRPLKLLYHTSSQIPSASVLSALSS